MKYYKLHSMSENILVTGSAGFIGFYLCKKLINKGVKVIGIDNINNYYDTKLKEIRLEILFKISEKNKSWKFIKSDFDTNWLGKEKFY